MPHINVVDGIGRLSLYLVIYKSVLPDNTLETLAARVLEKEHEFLVDMITKIVNNHNIALPFWNFFKIFFWISI